MLTWVNRITHIRTQELDLFGQMATRWRIVRISNAYVFRDPLPCHKPQDSHTEQPGSSKSENPLGTLNPEISRSTGSIPASPLAPDNPLTLALARLGNAMAAKAEKEIAMKTA